MPILELQINNWQMISNKIFFQNLKDYQMRYFVNKKEQDNGDHEVHTEQCFWRPNIENRIDLGVHTDCHSAIIEARKYYDQVNGCKVCLNLCNTD